MAAATLCALTDLRLRLKTFGRRVRVDHVGRRKVRAVEQLPGLEHCAAECRTMDVWLP